jgi:hypothetical protein
MGHAAAPEPPPPLSREAGSRAAGRVAVPEPSHLGSKDPELRCNAPFSNPYDYVNHMFKRP